jgi:ankyrin repeat protein
VLLDAGADPGKAGKYRKKDITPLGAALSRGKPEVVKMLVEGGAPITDAAMVTASQKLGGKSGKLEVFEYLLGKGGNPNAEMDGFTPLILAAMDGSAEGVRALLDAGADPNKAGKLGKKNDITPLGAAILGDSPEIAKILAKGGADVNAPAFAGLPAMDYAASMGKTELAKALAEAGADVNATGVLGIGAMHSAAREGDIDALQSLMKSGGDLNGRDDNGKTPLHHALTGGHADAAKMLLDAGADVNAADDNGVTPLMDAASSRSGGAVRTALRAGADPDAHDKDGKHAAEFTLGVDEALDPIVEASPEIQENRKAPKIEESGEVAAGSYVTPCEESGGDNVPVNADLCGASGSYKMAFSIIRENGSRAGKVVPPMCEPYDFKAGTNYRISVLKVSYDWAWECEHELKTTTGSVRSIAVKKKTNQQHSEKTIEVKAAGPAEKPEEEEEKEKDSLKVVLDEDPDDGKFAFDESDEGVLEIKVRAEVTGDIDPATIEWSMDKIGNSKMTVQPERGDTVTIRFEGMPDWNNQFGEKTITATGGGQSDSVTVKVFFDPQAKNSPRAGAGDAPNWFYYWGQTSAGRGFDPVYDPARKSCTGKPIVGQYDYKTDRLYLTDGIYSNVCAARVDGKHAEKYDCYAETLRHESVHGRELRAWWGEGADLPGCGVSDLPNNILKILIDHDSDLDLVPDGVEKQLAPTRGCDPLKSPSCEGVPWWLGVGDVEMNAYREGWAAWALCSNKGEDWSKDGQQWADNCT